MSDLEFLRPDLNEHSEPWVLSRDEGELAVDVYETPDAIFVKTAIAGVKPEDIQLALANDLLTIRGVRLDEDSATQERGYLCQECHWGPFSRTVLLPSEVNVSRAQATFKSGLLAIKLPKAHTSEEIKVRVEEE